MPWIRVLLSLFVAYHLYAMVLAPNTGSFLGRELGPSYMGYGNIIGLNTPWNFFSPDPAENFRIHYKVRFDRETDQKTIKGDIPSWWASGTFSPSERRELYIARLLMMDQSRLVSVLSPWLCRQHPGATEIVSRVVINKSPSLDRALLDVGGWRSQIEENELSAFTHYCVDITESEAL